MRRIVITALAGVVVLAVVLGVVLTRAPSPGAGPRTKPNILFVLTDDMAYSDLAAMPHVRALITDHGTAFSHAFVSVSLCCPSRSTILRGQYSHNTGVETNGGANGGFETAHDRGLEASTIATWLQADGYRTGLFGKYLNGYPAGASDTYVPPGWNEWNSATRGGNAYDQYDYTLNRNGRKVVYRNEPRDYGTTVYTRLARSFITRSVAEHRPFFAYLPVYAPHIPATPAPRDVNLFTNAQAPRIPSYNEANVGDKPAWVRSVPLMTTDIEQRVDELYRRRLASLQAVDRSVAVLTATLHRLHQLNDTYIVFMSDNGYHLGQHRLPAGKQTGYDEDIHVPLVMRGPGVPEGVTRPQLVGNVDIAPTLAELAGVKPPDFVDGRSLVPLLRSDLPPDEWRREFLVEHWREVPKPGQAAARAGVTVEPADTVKSDDETFSGPARPGVKHAHSAAEHDPAPEFHGVRTEKYAYLEYSTGERELYDLNRDPYELHNIAASAPADLLARLHRETEALETCRAEVCRKVEEIAP